MNVTFSTRLESAFALHRDRLKKLCDLLSDRVGPVKIELRCADEISRSYDDVKKSLEYENPTDKRINSIRLTARSGDGEKSATIEFRTGVWAGISIDLQGSEPVVTRLRSDILDILSGTRVWYSTFARIDPILAGLSLILVPLLAYMALALARGKVRFEDGIESRLTFWMLLGLATGNLLSLVLRVCGVPILSVWLWIFPTGSFLIGQGQQRHDDAEKFRWGVVIAFLVSLVAGLIPLAI